MKITDEMVEKAAVEFIARMNGGTTMTRYNSIPFAIKPMRAALETALSVADAPAPDDAEFEAALDEWFKAESAANWYRRNGLVGHFTADERAEAEARWELVIAEAESTRQRILTLYANARNAGLRAEPDAEFEAALTHYAVAVLDTQPRFVGFPTIEEADAEIKRTTKAYTPLRAARARVEALYADARNAGLRELREWIIERSRHTPVYVLANDTIDKIDAMLKGGDGE